MTSTKNATVRTGQTLRNISVQCDANIVSWHIAYSASAMSDALVSLVSASSDSSLLAKKLVTSGGGSSDSRIYGSFELKVGAYTFELNARYDEDNNVWQLTY